MDFVCDFNWIRELFCILLRCQYFQENFEYDMNSIAMNTAETCWFCIAALHYEILAINLDRNGWNAFSDDFKNAESISSQEIICKMSATLKLKGFKSILSCFDVDN